MFGVAYATLYPEPTEINRNPPWVAIYWVVIYWVTIYWVVIYPRVINITNTCTLLFHGLLKSTRKNPSKNKCLKTSSLKSVFFFRFRA